MPAAIEALQAAFSDQAAGQATNRPRQRVTVPHTQLHVMAAGNVRLGVTGLKAYSSARTGARFLVLLYDADSGDLLALIEADRLGQIRTGAASGVATRLLARPDARTVGLVGSGWQAESQLEAVCTVRPIVDIAVYSRTPEKRDAFAARMSARLGIAVTPVSTAEQAVRGRDIVVTATSSHEPVLVADWLASGTHVNAIGANAIGRQELDLSVMRRATVLVVDSLEQARVEAGDLVRAVERGAIAWEGVRELAQLVVAPSLGRRGPKDVTVFRSLGIALEDLAVAWRVYDLAQAAGIGESVDFWTRR